MIPISSQLKTLIKLVLSQYRSGVPHGPICLRLTKLYMFQQVSSYGAGQAARTVGGVVSNRTIDDSYVHTIGGVDPATTIKDKAPGLIGGRAERVLPPDATNTLFVEGLPSNCTRREVARILLSDSSYFVAFNCLFKNHLNTSICNIYYKNLPILFGTLY